jgi:hypothetical protein
MVCDLVIPIYVFLFCSSSNCPSIHDLVPLIVVFFFSRVGCHVVHGLILLIFSIIICLGMRC